MVSTAVRASKTAATPSFSLLQAAAVAGARRAAAQGFEPRGALGERIESARFAAQRILCLEGHALRHERQLLAQARRPGQNCASARSARRR